MPLENVVKALEWRYATKKFDPTKKIGAEDMHEILESLRLSPSSYGLQTWKFVVVKNRKLREALKPHAWNQPQVTDASEFIVLCAPKNVDTDYVKKYVADIAKTRNLSVDSLKGYEDMMTGAVQRMTPEHAREWKQRQIYIALGFLMSVCAFKKIDTCPMEGFVPAKFDEILELSSLGLESVVCCALGYRASDDVSASLKKVRLTQEEVFIFKN